MHIQTVCLLLTPPVMNIKSIAQFLKSSKGNDDLSPLILKEIILEISLPLTTIFNKSFANGPFSDKLKIAKIVPFYKSDKLLVSNYRPISILPFFSKILERLMYNWLLNYLNNNNILTDKQYGFRERHNTSMALLRMINDVTQELDSNHFCIGLF